MNTLSLRAVSCIRMWLKLTGAIIFIGFGNNDLLSQIQHDNPYALCGINVSDEPEDTSTTRYASNAENVFCETGYRQWEDLDNLSMVDGAYTKSWMFSNETSKCLKLSNFGFDLFDSDQIHGFEISIVGRVEGGQDGDIQTKKLLLLNKNDDKIVPEIRTKLAQGSEWPVSTSDNFEWTYRVDLDDNYFVAGDVLNDASLMLAVRNEGDMKAMVLIDAIKIKLIYKPTYAVCDHNCIEFFINPYPGADNYWWYFPKDFYLFGQETAYGPKLSIGTALTERQLYEVCVDVYSGGEVIDHCCRSFLLDDCRPSSIGDFVWNDLNANGIQDEGEPGLPGVEVYLFNEENEAIDTVITDELGMYCFTDVETGFYHVAIQSQEGYTATLPMVGSGDTDSDITGTHGLFNTDKFHLGPNNDRKDIDFGVLQAGKIGGRIWVDKNGNNIEDDSERGISDLAIDLIHGGEVVASTQTDENGFYLFTDLFAGSYTVRVSEPDGFERVMANIGDEDVDSDINDEGLIPNIQLDPGECDDQNDGGYFQLASIGDLVWLDLNKDGIQDEMDTGIENITLQLLNAEGVIIGTTTSDENGFYTFSNLNPGEYTIRIVDLNGRGLTTFSVGSEEESDSDFQNIDGIYTTPTINLESGQALSSIDAGLISLEANIGNLVWLDINMNGIQDADEPGIADINVKLFNTEGVLVGEQITDENGNYKFEDIYPGEYYIQIDNYDCLLPTPYRQGTNSEQDSDLLENYSSSTFVLNECVDDYSLDFGLKTANRQIGDYVWVDSNENGLQDIDESGLGGVTINLFDASGAWLAQTVTNNDGYYTFDNIELGDYYLEVVSSNCYESTNHQVGDDRTVDSDLLENLYTNIFSINGCDSDFTIDMGIVIRHYTIGDCVWLDTDKDGLQDESEQGISGVTVTLYTASGEVGAETVTDADGKYRFENVPLGNYYLGIGEVSCYEPTMYQSGEDGEIDSDLLENSQTAVFELGCEDRLDIDLGLREPTLLTGNYVWNDTNGNGIQDEGELGVEGVKVLLYSSTGELVGETFTNSDGLYFFRELDQGDYYVSLETEECFAATLYQAGEDGEIDSDLLEDFSSGVFTLAGCDSDFSIDLGIVERSFTIGDCVWLDTDKDGLQDESEQGISGVTVTLYTASGEVGAETVTDADGKYRFENVPLGNYYLGIGEVSCYEPTMYQSGEDGEIDSDLLENSQTAVFELGCEDRLDIDLGLREPTLLTGNYVWNDSNGNGIQDEGELGVEGIKVLLYTSSGELVGETFTNSDGLYFFRELDQGEYYVSLETEECYAATVYQAGEDGEIDSDLFENFSSGVFTLAGCDSDFSIDLGIIERRFTIGDCVWLDTDKDGLQDESEQGISGVTVTLYTASGEVGAETVTDADGKYRFENVPLGNYYLGIGEVSCYEPTMYQSGEDSEIDSDLLENSQTAVFELGCEDRLDIDLGLREPTLLTGNYVWNDTNGNGIQDEGGLGVEGIKVLLYTSSGELVGETFTNSDGLYFFRELDQGDYYVSLETEECYAATVYQAGEDGEIDSDLLENFSSGVFTLSGCDSDFSIDLGIVERSFTIGDCVWLDTDKDGLQDESEQGISGVTITLYTASGEVGAETVTDADGKYRFENVPLGNYYLGIGEVSCYEPTMYQSGEDGEIDSDLLENSQTAVFELGCEDRLDIDLGLVESTIDFGDYVWNDSNGNGIQDEDEVGISGLLIQLFNSSGEYVGEVTTDANGNYIFTDIAPGEYYLSIATEGCFESTTYQAGENPAIDSDLLEDLRSSLFTLSGCDADFDIDLGIVIQETQIGDYVWMDNNNDGIQNENDEGISGVIVQLFSESGILVAETITDENGFYSFDNIEPGKYYISIPEIGCLEATAFQQGGSETLDSDLLENLSTQVFEVSPCSSNASIDLGLTGHTLSLGDFVWLDRNKNGIQDENEPGIQDVQVQLYSEEGTLLATVVTDATGKFNFSDLPAGEYYLALDQFKCYEPTLYQAGSNQEVNSDLLPNYQTDIFSLQPCASRADVDLGLCADPVNIGDYVWLDEDEDGIQDPEDWGLEDIKVTLYDENGNFVQEDFTNKQGHYIFTDLGPGNYYIEIEGYDCHQVTEYQSGDDSNVDSDLLENYQTEVFEIDGCSSDLSVDLGLKYAKLAIGNYVWLDVNRDGLQNPSEIGVEGVTVKLFRRDGTLVGETTTDEEGFYLFTDLPPRKYYIELEGVGDYEPTMYQVGNDSSIDSDLLFENDRYFSPEFELLSCNSDINFDFGLVDEEQLGVLQGIAWVDENMDGQRTTEEARFEGVTVNLRDAQGVIIQTTVTDELGQYTFASLTAGDYQVEFINPNGFVLTVQNQGDDTTDSDIDTSTGTSDLISINFGENKSVDVGYIFNFGIIKGEVFIDNNLNFVNDAEDSHAAGVDVELYSAQGILLDQTQTKENGQYSFGQRVPGEYYVVFGIKNGYSFIPANQGDETMDSDVDSDIVFGSTSIFTVDAGGADYVYDAGIGKDESIIAGRVWEELNNDGIRQADEPMITEVTISLFNQNGELQKVEAAGLDGSYRFENIPSGTYYVHFDLPDESIFTASNIGDESTDSDVTGAVVDGSTDLITVDFDDLILNVDAGIYFNQNDATSFGDYVWHDLNANGVQDENEPGINGVTIELLSSAGEVVGTVISTEHPTLVQDGYYHFHDIPDGEYYLRFLMPDGFDFSPSNNSSDDQKDSDVTQANGPGTTDILTVPQGENHSIDAGVFRYTTIGDYIWNDTNFNGLQDVDEPGVNNVRVRLYDDAGNQVATTFSDNDLATGAPGFYSFEVKPGSYYLEFGAGEDLLFTNANIGPDENVDSDVTNQNGSGTTDIFDLVSSLDRLNIDAGLLQEPGSIGDFVWLDINGNGVQDNQENGVNGVEITLHNENGDILQTTTTATNEVTHLEGWYLFENIPSGDYYLSFNVSEEYLFADALSSGNVSTDSDVTGEFGRGTTGIITIGSAEDNTDVDAGIFVPSSIGDRVWRDVNQNGLQDEGEPGVGGVTVTLMRSSGFPIESTITDQEGKYRFSDLKQGNYFLNFSAPNGQQFTTPKQGTNDELDSDVFPNGNTAIVILSHGFDFVNFDAGLLPAANLLGGRVWHDSNENGIQDQGEEGYENVTTRIFDENDNLMLVTQTRVDGRISIGDLPSGRYYIKYEAPEGFHFVTKNEGNDDAMDSDVSETGRGDLVWIDHQNSANLDAGVAAPASIFTRAWVDQDGNGLMDDDELGIAGIEIELVDTEENLVSQAHTLASEDAAFEGTAIFEEIKAGWYQLKYHIDEDYIHTIPFNDLSSDMNSDVEFDENGDFMSKPIFIESAQTLYDINAGFYVGAKIGNFVWDDINENGIQDSNEPGIRNVRIKLFDENHQLINITVSDGEGYFEFKNIMTGAYYVEFVAPTNRAFTRSVSSLFSELDSDVDGSNGYGTTAMIHVVPSQVSYDIDAGFVQSRPLAIDDSSLSGEYVGNGNLIRLNPGTEQSISAFVLEKSIDGETFVPINRWKPQEKSEYTYLDQTLGDATVHYYRAKDIFLNGEERVSKVMSIRSYQVDEISLRASPNPTTDFWTIDVDQDWDVTAIQILGNDQRVLRNIDIRNIQNGRLVIDSHSLETGMYHLVIHHDGFSSSTKLLSIR